MIVNMRVICGMVIISIGLGGQPAWGLTKAKAVGLDLRRQLVRIQRLEHGVLSFFDETRQLRVEPAQKFAQLLIESRGTDPLPEGPEVCAVVLNDGQWVVGRWVGVHDDGEVLYLQHPALGPVAVNLEDVSRFWPNRSVDDDFMAEGPFERIVSDRVVLLNGDVLEGFVAAIESHHVKVESTAQDGVLEIALDRTRLIRLASVLESPRPDMDVVYLADGSRWHVADLLIGSDRIFITPALCESGEAVGIELSRVLRIDLARHGVRLVDLTSLSRKVVAGGSAFGISVPPRVQGADLWMHAPLQIEFDLPLGADRFAAELALEMVDGKNSGDRAWADVIVNLVVDGKNVGRFHLDGESTNVHINVPITGRVMTVELDEAANGPVLDRVLLRDAILLVKDPR